MSDPLNVLGGNFGGLGGLSLGLFNDPVRGDAGLHQDMLLEQASRDVRIAASQVTYDPRHIAATSLAAEAYFNAQQQAQASLYESSRKAQKAQMSAFGAPPKSRPMTVGTLIELTGRYPAAERLVLSPRQWEDLRCDCTAGQWIDIQMAAAGRPVSAVFSGCEIVVNNATSEARLLDTDGEELERFATTSPPPPSPRKPEPKSTKPGPLPWAKLRAKVRDVVENLIDTAWWWLEDLDEWLIERQETR